MHNKQFIITNRKVRLDNFKSIVWIDGYILNYHNELNVVKVGNSILIGHAFQGDFNRKIPEEELVSMDSPIDTYNTWNGRWALLYKNEISAYIFCILSNSILLSLYVASKKLFKNVLADSSIFFSSSI